MHEGQGEGLILGDDRKSSLARSAVEFLLFRVFDSLLLVIISVIVVFVTIAVVGVSVSEQAFERGEPSSILSVRV